MTVTNTSAMTFLHGYLPSTHTDVWHIDTIAKVMEAYAAQAVARERERVAADIAWLEARIDILDREISDASTHADKILPHFNDDGSLKDEGKWRAAEIYKHAKGIDAAFASSVSKLNAQPPRHTVNVNSEAKA